MARKKRMQFIPYDYEAAYNKSLEEMHEWFIENLFQHRKKVVYALKEISQKMDITLFIRILSNTVRLLSGRPLASNRFRMIISLKARERLNLYR